MQWRDKTSEEGVGIRRETNLWFLYAKRHNLPPSLQQLPCHSVTPLTPPPTVGTLIPGSTPSKLGFIVSKRSCVYTEHISCPGETNMLNDQPHKADNKGAL